MLQSSDIKFIIRFEEHLSDIFGLRTGLILDNGKNEI